MPTHESLGESINAAITESYSENGRYEGPWVIGVAKCGLCGNTSFDMIPLLGYEDGAPLECASCGQRQSSFHKKNPESE